MLSIGVFGVGHLGKFHLNNWKEIPGVELVGFYDPNDDTANEVSEKYQLPRFLDPDMLIDACDAIDVVAPTTYHFDLCEKAIKKGKHVFVEKPLANTMEEARLLVKLAEESGIKFQVGHVERFNPAFLALKDVQLNPMFIEVHRLAQFNPRGTEVSVILDLMIHDIDIILSLVKSPVARVEASGVGVVSDLIDIANARIEFENGAVANVTASRISQKKMRKMRIFQKDNYISLDFTTGNSEVFRITDAEEKIATGYISFGEIGAGEKKKKVIYEQPEAREVNALKYELELFVRSVQTRTRPVVSGEDGLRALQVAALINEKITESLNKIRMSQ